MVNNFDSFNTRLDQGTLLENAAYVGIKRRLDYEQKIYKMGFFRSKTGSEIDIVVKTEEEKLYEVKASEKFTAKKGKIKYITMENIWRYL